MRWAPDCARLHPRALFSDRPRCDWIGLDWIGLDWIFDWLPTENGFRFVFRLILVYFGAGPTGRAGPEGPGSGSSDPFFTGDEEEPVEEVGLYLPLHDDEGNLLPVGPPWALRSPEGTSS